VALRLHLKASRAADPEVCRTLRSVEGSMDRWRQDQSMLF